VPLPPAAVYAAPCGVRPNTQALNWLIVKGSPAIVRVVLRVSPEFDCTL
jgi:hypothetical protein